VWSGSACGTFAELRELGQEQLALLLVGGDASVRRDDGSTDFLVSEGGEEVCRVVSEDGDEGDSALETAVLRGDDLAAVLGVEPGDDFVVCVSRAYSV